MFTQHKSIIQVYVPAYQEGQEEYEAYEICYNYYHYSDKDPFFMPEDLYQQIQTGLTASVCFDWIGDYADVETMLADAWDYKNKDISFETESGNMIIRVYVGYDQKDLTVAEPFKSHEYYTKNRGGLGSVTLTHEDQETVINYDGEDIMNIFDIQLGDTLHFDGVSEVTFIEY